MLETKQFIVDVDSQVNEIIHPGLLVKLPLVARPAGHNDDPLWFGSLEGAGQPGHGLRAALEGLESVPGTAVNDVSAGQVCLTLAGESARQVLAKGCTLDFHPDVFGVGACAQSGLARATVLVAQITDEPEYELYVRRSYADYLARWLHHSGREFGIEFYITLDPRSRD